MEHTAKYMGIDFGTSRIGVALSDDAGQFAFPKGIIDRATALPKIVSVCLEEGVKQIIIGESVATNEVPNVLIHAANAFVEELKNRTGLPVVFEREDFSTVEAHRYQTAPGARDDSAAAIILQRYLDKVVKNSKK